MIQRRKPDHSDMLFACRLMIKMPIKFFLHLQLEAYESKERENLHSVFEA
jgi:hypothetical protein